MMAQQQTMPEPDMKGIRGELRQDESMVRHTTWRAGGPADWFFQPADRDDLCRFLTQLPDMPVTFIGLGSNLLVRDNGVRGVVIRSHKGLSESSVQKPGVLTIEAGVACAQAARFCNRSGYVGAEFLAGIPGSMGGALAMNAGAFGGETWNVVERAELINKHGVLRRVTRQELNPGYRSVHIPDDHWFVSATLKLESGDTQASRQRIGELLKTRGASQPVQSANAGSVFKNPEGGFSAQLIEQAGLKGTREGFAQVSIKHANFIINTGGALARDIETLILRVQAEVLRHSGVALEVEVRIIGE